MNHSRIVVEPKNHTIFQYFSVFGSWVLPHIMDRIHPYITSKEQENHIKSIILASAAGPSWVTNKPLIYPAKIHDNYLVGCWPQSKRMRIEKMKANQQTNQ